MLYDELSKKIEAYRLAVASYTAEANKYKAWADVSEAFTRLAKAKAKVVKALEAKAEAWAAATYYSAKASSAYEAEALDKYINNELFALDEYNVFCNHAFIAMNEDNNE